MEKEENKAVNDLKFSDFIGSGHVYDHTKDDIWEALGANEKDCDMVRDKMLSVFKGDNDKISQNIEETLKFDIPAPWKAFGYMKIGAGSVRGMMLALVSEAPDDIPVPVLKGLLIMAIKGAGNI